MSRHSALPPDWSPRHYREGDDEGVLDVLRATFGQWPKVQANVPAIDHLRWKMTNHSSALLLDAVGEVGGRIIAWQCYWMQRVQVHGRELLAKQGVDFCVHPDFQRLGIRKKFYQLAMETPHRNFHVNFGPDSGHPAMRRVEDALDRAEVRTIANQIQALVWQRERSPAPNVWARASLTVGQATAFDQRFDAFGAAAAEPFDFLCTRDSNVLNWRYADPRAGRFAIHVCEEGTRVLGFAASSLPHNGRAAIADLLALPGRVDVVGELLATAIAKLVEAGASKIEAWLPTHHPYQSLFLEQGFRRRNRAVSFLLRPATEYEASLDMSFRSDPRAAIHISLGDSDLV
jgi:GNAT superfamily N-acetyltransferase